MPSLVLSFSMWKDVDAEPDEKVDILIGEVNVPLNSINLDEGGVFHSFTLQPKKMSSTDIKGINNNSILWYIT